MYLRMNNIIYIYIYVCGEQITRGGVRTADFLLLPPPPPPPLLGNSRATIITDYIKIVIRILCIIGGVYVHAKYVPELHYHRTGALSSSRGVISADRIGRAWASEPAIVTAPAVYTYT